MFKVFENNSFTNIMISLYFIQGDICNMNDVQKACEGIHTVFHTASPQEGCVSLSI